MKLRRLPPPGLTGQKLIYLYFLCRVVKTPWSKRGSSRKTISILTLALTIALIPTLTLILTLKLYLQVIGDSHPRP